MLIVIKQGGTQEDNAQNGMRLIVKFGFLFLAAFVNLWYYTMYHAKNCL